jgi:MaoC dehydratase-like protein
MNTEAAGTIYQDRQFVVDPERVAAFRGVFGDDDGVPPTFVTAAEFLVFPEILADDRVGLDLSRVVHGSQAYVFSRSLVEGETLTVRTRIDAVHVRAGNAFMTIVTELVSADGALVATARSTMVERAAVP